MQPVIGIWGAIENLSLPLDSETAHLKANFELIIQGQKQALVSFSEGLPLVEAQNQLTRLLSENQIDVSSVFVPQFFFVLSAFSYYPGDYFLTGASNKRESPRIKVYLAKNNDTIWIQADQVVTKGGSDFECALYGTCQVDDFKKNTLEYLIGGKPAELELIASNFSAQQARESSLSMQTRLHPAVLVQFAGKKENEALDLPYFSMLNKSSAFRRKFLKTKKTLLDSSVNLQKAFERLENTDFNRDRQVFSISSGKEKWQYIINKNKKNEKPFLSFLQQIDLAHRKQGASVEQRADLMALLLNCDQQLGIGSQIFSTYMLSKTNCVLGGGRGTNRRYEIDVQLHGEGKFDAMVFERTLFHEWHYLGEPIRPNRRRDFPSLVSNLHFEKGRFELKTVSFNVTPALAPYVLPPEVIQQQKQEVALLGDIEAIQKRTRVEMVVMALFGGLGAGGVGIGISIGVYIGLAGMLSGAALFGVVATCGVIGAVLLGIGVGIGIYYLVKQRTEKTSQQIKAKEGALTALGLIHQAVRFSSAPSPSVSPVPEAIPTDPLPRPSRP